MRRTFKYRLFPTKAQETILAAQLEECRWLYNHFLEQRKTSYAATKTAPSMYDQQNTLPALKKQRPSLISVYSQVLQNVATRIDLAFKAFFRRVKAGEKPGYPRFKGQGQYDSMTFPQVPEACKLLGTNLVVSKVGNVKVVLDRPLEGKAKICTIRRSSTGKWYATFNCEIQKPEPLPISTEQAGIDVGLASFATLSTGEEISNPRFFRTDEKELAKVQRKLSKATKSTPERTKRRKPVSRIHERIAFRRKNFVEQQSRRIVNRFGFIAVEDLEVNRMVKDRRFSKSISDVAWSEFFKLLFVKAESAGRTIVKVNPAYTTQTCSNCGHRQKLSLSERVYRCSACKFELGRDHNAALNIIALGLQSIRGNPVEAPPLCGGE